MFTVAQIEAAHSKVRSGADFPQYIRDIKTMGVTGFITWVKDSHTEYHGAGGFCTASKPKYAALTIAAAADVAQFRKQLKAHQQGQTDYKTFCLDCAAAGVEKWIVDLHAMTCIYYDAAGTELVVEQIPG